MTREKEINKAIEKYIGRELYPDISRQQHLETIAFWEGAKWADEHPKSPWIICMEKMPKDDTPVLTTNGNEFSVARYFGNNEWINATIPCKAWMPIPPIPQKGGAR